MQMTSGNSHSQQNSPIQEFLRCCLNVRRHPPDLELARDMAEDLDWDEIFAYAAKKFIAPTLYSNTKGAGIIPEEMEEAFHSTYIETAQRNLVQANALKKLLTLFSEEGVECMPLKGLALAIPVYGDIAARQSRDIDLIIRPTDLMKALDLASALGYERYNVPEHASTDFEFENEVILFRRTDSMNLDLHWSLFDSPFYQHRLDMGWFWSQSMEFTLSGMKSRTLAPESNLIYLCGHLSLHHFGDELLWSNDIAELLFRFQAQLDWERILEKAREFHLVLSMQHVLMQLYRDWQAPIPAWLIEALELMPVSEEERAVYEGLSEGRQTAGPHFWSDIKHLEGWGKRATYIIQLVFPTRDYMLHRYKIIRPMKLPLYYPYRWWLGIKSFFQARE